MRPRIQSGVPREEDEHPYELLLTAETKKLGAPAGRTKGTPSLLPSRAQERVAGGQVLKMES